MVKSCCAVGCVKRAVKGCGVSFYRFLADLDRRASWVAAIRSKKKLAFMSIYPAL